MIMSRSLSACMLNKLLVILLCMIGCVQLLELIVIKIFASDACKYTLVMVILGKRSSASLTLGLLDGVRT